MRLLEVPPLCPVIDSTHNLTCKHEGSKSHINRTVCVFHTFDVVRFRTDRHCDVTRCIVVTCSHHEVLAGGWYANRLQIFDVTFEEHGVWSVVAPAFAVKLAVLVGDRQLQETRRASMRRVKKHACSGFVVLRYYQYNTSDMNALFLTLMTCLNFTSCT